MSHLLNKVRSLVDEGKDPATAVSAALKGATRADVNDTLQPLLLDEAKARYRSHVRGLEKRAFPQSSEAQPTPDVQADARQRLMAESFPLPDGRMVEWKLATVEDHRLRSSWLKSHAQSALNTASRHDAAADLIESAGATCLADAELAVPA